MSERKLIGEVGVDSAQLMLIDPCYLESSWRMQKDSALTGIRFWGRDGRIASESLRQAGHDVYEEEGQTYWIAVDDVERYHELQGEIATLCRNGWLVVTHECDDSSYQEACRTTTGPDGAGLLAHGLGAVVSTGYGDGRYPVYVTLNREGRVAKVEVIFDEEEG